MGSGKLHQFVLQGCPGASFYLFFRVKINTLDYGLIWRNCDSVCQRAHYVVLIAE